MATKASNVALNTPRQAAGADNQSPPDVTVARAVNRSPADSQEQAERERHQPEMLQMAQGDRTAQRRERKDGHEPDAGRRGAEHAARLRFGLPDAPLLVEPKRVEDNRPCRCKEQEQQHVLDADARREKAVQSAMYDREVH